MDISSAGQKTAYDSDIRNAFGGVILTGRVRVRSMAFRNTNALDRELEVLDGTSAVVNLLTVPGSSPWRWVIPFEQDGFTVRGVAGGGGGVHATVVYEELT